MRHQPTPLLSLGPETLAQTDDATPAVAVRHPHYRAYNHQAVGSNRAAPTQNLRTGRREGEGTGETRTETARGRSGREPGRADGSHGRKRTPKPAERRSTGAERGGRKEGEAERDETAAHLVGGRRLEELTQQDAPTPGRA
jgi:hypothetical protein